MLQLSGSVAPSKLGCARLQKKKKEIVLFFIHLKSKFAKWDGFLIKLKPIREHTASESE